MTKRKLLIVSIILFAISLSFATCSSDVFSHEDNNPPLEGRLTINRMSPKVGDIITATYYGSKDGTPTWKWFRDDLPIPNTNCYNYQVVAEDRGRTLKVQLKYSEHSGSITSAPTAVVQ